ncbi:MAG: hypothetical protein HOA67_00885 [Candidatus Marinimicrobia bacterium]|nr:hypothetical protein [Candidatus Neomarinimicrobiota bacterium]MBT7172591.1 hypothetical protein [Candidatus Neomarinimicrobiota bacterium]
MEELLYWGAIAGFYLWSAYRSNQKKAKKLVPNQAPAKKDLKNPQIPNNQEINVLDFLNRAFEESAVPGKEEVSRRAVLSNKSEHAIQDKFLDHFNSKHDLSIVDDRHIDSMSSRLNRKVKKVQAKKKKPLELIQKKYRKNPTKLAMTMQAIFEQPKAMQ